jgi:hypothetical protein
MALPRPQPGPAILPNGSTRDGPLQKSLEAQRHGEHPFELAIEMELVVADP